MFFFIDFMCSPQVLAQPGDYCPTLLYRALVQTDFFLALLLPAELVMAMDDGYSFRPGGGSIGVFSRYMAF